MPLVTLPSVSGSAGFNEAAGADPADARWQVDSTPEDQALQ